MNWFYAQDGRQAGPVEDNELDRLAQTGTINGATLVWHSGMASWQPYSQARPAAAAIAPVPAYAGGMPGPTAPSPGTMLAPAAGGVRCSECAQVFPADEVVQVEGLNVCANCKPLLLQKLREGVRPVGAGMNYAGFWIRFGAVFIDGIILNIVGRIIGFIIGAAFAGGSNDANGALVLVTATVGLLIGAAYEIYFISQKGATPGKMACGLRVVTPEGGRISVGRAIGRYFAKFLSAIILCIGYIMAAFDSEKRALHDQICDTRVIKVR